MSAPSSSAANAAPGFPAQGSVDSDEREVPPTLLPIHVAIRGVRDLPSTTQPFHDSGDESVVEVSKRMCRVGEVGGATGREGACECVRARGGGESTGRQM